MPTNTAVWFPTIRTNTGTDVFTKRLVKGLQKNGIQAEITWLPLRAEYAPWSVSTPKAPEWATIVHVNTWLHPRFLPQRLPVVATIHHSIHHADAQRHKGLRRHFYHKCWVAPIEQSVMKRADKVVAVSQFVADTAKATLVDLPMQVIYNGIDTNIFTPGNRVRNPDEPFRLLYVGSWKTLKGVDLFSEIFRNLGDEFVLYYTGGETAAKDKSRMPDNMHDIGYLHGDAAVAAALQNSDALIFPSRAEGFGLVALEAMACGVPVIASKNSSLVEIIEDGDSGLLCTTDDVAAMILAIRKLANNTELYMRLRVGGYTRARTMFNEYLFIQKHLNLYKQLTQ